MLASLSFAPSIFAVNRPAFLLIVSTATVFPSFTAFAKAGDIFSKPFISFLIFARPSAYLSVPFSVSNSLNISKTGKLFTVSAPARSAFKGS